MTRIVRPICAAGLILAGLTVWTEGRGEALGDDAVKLPPAAKNEVDFARDIQPILTAACLKCHGPEKQQAGFRLDSRQDAVRGGDSGVAFETGKSAESLLIKYVAGLDPDIVMPPEGEKLTPDQIGLLRAWIDQGAKWSDDLDANRRINTDHWSFQPIRRPVPPVVKRDDWIGNPIDRFILGKLEGVGIAPSPEADQRTLIRRLSLDLLGLPPTPAEVEQFVADPSADAYGQLVDRLLASPHFGERWGRHWLDLARYADSDGYEKDSPRPHAWRYRNWVIDAINRDLPFDQFTIEQLAGDLLPDATLEQKVATGFHRNTLTNKEGGADQEEFRVAAVVDRVNTTSSVWLGLTLGCAQCHSHKYDPIVLHEYYGMFAFFNQGQEVDLPAPLSQEADAYRLAKQAFDPTHAPFVQAIDEFQKNELPSRQAEWEARLDRAVLVSWTVLDPVVVESANGVTLTKQPDGSFLATGNNPDVDTYTFIVRTELIGITAFRLETLADASLPAKGPGRVAHGNFVLSELSARATNSLGETQAITFQNPQADFSQEKYPVAAAIDGDSKTGWAVAPQFGTQHVAVFETTGDVGIRGATTLTMTLDQRHGGQHTLGRFRLSATTASRPVKLYSFPDDIVPILQMTADQRSSEQIQKLSAYYATLDPELAKLKQAETEHAKKGPTPPVTQAQTLTDISQPRPTHIHIRGDFLRKGDEVQPHTPAVLHRFTMPAGKTPNRLDLAKWLVDPRNPLTARVTVNRIWKHLFGQALVTSLEDFGTRGEKPSHPELLDWLASEFVSPQPADGAVATASPVPAPGATPNGTGAWSVKRLIRRIVMSQTYRQSSHPRQGLVERDPKNVLLARQNRFRVEAEVLRDLYLAASGLLAPKVGGPSVRPKQPAGISELTYAGSVRWVESTGADRYRRGLYTWFQRTSPYPMLMTFDAPDSNVACTRRERSNTPLQALTLLNDPVFFECAQALGRRIVADRPMDVDDRLRFAFELCLSRNPQPDEIGRLVKLHAEFQALAAANPEAAGKLVGEPRPPDADLAEAAAAIAVARVILNLDEFVTRE